MIKKYVESDGNKLESGDLIFNYIFKYPGQPKSKLYVDLRKIERYVILLMRKVAIPNLDVKS